MPPCRGTPRFAGNTESPSIPQGPRTPARVAEPHDSQGILKVPIPGATTGGLTYVAEPHDSQGILKDRIIVGIHRDVGGRGTPRFAGNTESVDVRASMADVIPSRNPTIRREY